MMNKNEAIEYFEKKRKRAHPCDIQYYDTAISAIHRVEKAERERDAAVQLLTSIIRYGTNPCECCKADCIDAGSDDAEYVSQCGMFELSGPQKEE